MTLNLQNKTYEDGLASYAQKSAISIGRDHPELPDPYRNPYQRDKDRIIHCRAFRRLEYKTQVLFNPFSDHHRTRLTHTIEVSQIARSIARTLGLHEDLVEALALAHDLGHPPFGHAGEGILADLLGGTHGFDHNIQALRIIEKLENRYPQFPGLNLTHEVRHGLIKHRDDPAIRSHFGMRFDLFEFPILESQIMDVADEVAYSCHDLEDGLTHQFLAWDDVRHLSIIENLNIPYRPGQGIQSFEVFTYHLSRALMNALVVNLVTTTRHALVSHAISSPRDVTDHPGYLIAFSPRIGIQVQELRDFLVDNFYRHPFIEAEARKARDRLTYLFDHYSKHPHDLPDSTREKLSHRGLSRVIGDYIAGMTDRFALEDSRQKGFS